MKLSPLELRKHQFAKRFRLSGFDPDEVNGFVRQMADQWGEVLEENRRMEDRIRELQNKVGHYEKVELALQEALETARNTARQVEDNAQRKAELTIEEAELRAQRMLQDAEQERFGIKQDLVKLSARQTEIAARMRAFLMSEMEVLAQFQGDDPIGFIRLISAAESPPAGRLTESVSAKESVDPEADDASASLASEGPVGSSADFDPDAEATEEHLSAGADLESSSAVAPKLAPVESPDATAASDPVHETPIDVERRTPVAFPQPPANPYLGAVPAPHPPAEEMPPPTASPAPVVEPIAEEAPIPPPPIPAQSVVQALERPIMPPAPPPIVEEVAARRTYGDMLSGAQPESTSEATADPFNSSFFESPFAVPPSVGDADTRGPAPGSDAAHDWSLRSLVTGDGDNEPTVPSPSEVERDRIRRILEDLD